MSNQADEIQDVLGGSYHHVVDYDEDELEAGKPE